MISLFLLKMGRQKPFPNRSKLITFLETRILQMLIFQFFLLQQNHTLILKLKSFNSII